MTKNLDILRQATRHRKSVAIIGMAKNAGKTSVLNALVHAYRDQERALVLTSAGFDGEREDRLSGETKPRVYLFPGMYVVTSKHFLKSASIDPEVIEIFQHDTLFGPPVLVRAKQAGFIELSGPTSLIDLAEIKRAIRELWPGALFVIDGALDRKGNARASYADAVILALSPGEMTPTQLKKQVEEQFSWLQIPLLKSGSLAEIKASRLYPYTGALTDRVAASLIADELTQGDTILIEDRANSFLGRSMRHVLEEKGIAVVAAHGAELILFSFNPKRRDGSTVSGDPYRTVLNQMTTLPILELDVEPALGRAV